MAEIATRWVQDGTADDLVEWQRAAIRRRQAIVAETLAGSTFRAHPESLHVWLPLSKNKSEDGFVAQARLQGVAIAPGVSFRISDAPWEPAVRISLGSTSEDELRTGLGIVARLMLADPEHLLLAI